MFLGIHLWSKELEEKTQVEKCYVVIVNVTKYNI